MKLPGLKRVFCLVCALHGLVSVAWAQSGEITSSDPISYPEIRAMGFGDVNYISRESSEEDGFVVGQAVAHVTASLDQSLSVFGEFTATGSDSEYSFEVERLIVKYDFSDTFKVSAGRYHTPIGYWNETYHHGSWLQTTASRPEMVRFGSRLVPIHFVGLLFEGNIPFSNLGLMYKAGVGNGRHENIARAGDAGDINGDKAWTVQISARPKAWYGLDVGVGVYSDEIDLEPDPSAKETTFSAYAAWTKESPEIILEYMHSTHESVADSSITGDVEGWYAQFAYRLKGKNSAWKPYLRIEHQEIDDSDPVLGADGLNYDTGILGVRWDFNPYAALKAEYRNEEFDDGGRENNFRLQVCFVLAKL